ncbi:hypothetical protein Hdeb2414_s0002g00072041 [Helianthus debilis subsp. tardiflorus]
MVRERADWEGYRERMLKRIADFEQARAIFDEERAKFDVDKKAEEWGREGLKNKLHNAEQQLAKEKAEFKRICERDNERAFAARNKIVDLEAKVAELTVKVEAAQAAKQQIEVELAETKVQFDLRTLHFQVVELVLQFLNLITRTILLPHQLLEIIPGSGIRHLNTQHLHLGIPPG